MRSTGNKRNAAAAKETWTKQAVGNAIWPSKAHLCIRQGVGKYGVMRACWTRQQGCRQARAVGISHLQGANIYSRTSLLRTPGDFADLFVVSIGRCNHGPLNQIRYTKLPKQTLKKTETGIDIIDYI